MTFTVGLTGGIGCGKSSVAHLFAERGAALVDTDVIAHELTGPGSPVLSAIRKLFGKEIFQSDGALNRMELRRKVFADAQARKKLESLLHPLIRAKALQQLAACDAPYAILVVPLLLETGSLREQVQRVLVVDCSEAQQVARTITRSGLSEEEVRAIMKTQLSRAARLKLGDDVLVNDGGLAELGERVEALHRHYLELADAHRAHAAAAD